MFRNLQVLEKRTERASERIMPVASFVYERAKLVATGESQPVIYRLPLLTIVIS